MKFLTKLLFIVLLPGLLAFIGMCGIAFGVHIYPEGWPVSVFGVGSALVGLVMILLSVWMGYMVWEDTRDD